MIANIVDFEGKTVWLRRSLDRKPYLVTVKRAVTIDKIFKSKSPFKEDDCELSFRNNYRVLVLYSNGVINEVSNEFLFHTWEEAKSIAPIRPRVMEVKV